MVHNEVMARAETKRGRKNADRLAMVFAPVVASGHPGPAFKRAGERRIFRAYPTFDHGSASAAAMRHKASKNGKPRRPKPPAFVKKPYDPIDHVHPRSKREALRAQRSN